MSDVHARKDSVCEQEPSSLNTTFRVTQLDSEVSNENFSILGNDEIPPTYEQAVKESRV